MQIVKISHGGFAIGSKRLRRSICVARNSTKVRSFREHHDTKFRMWCFANRGIYILYTHVMREA
jgi:hypothetical protein